MVKYKYDQCREVLKMLAKDVQKWENNAFSLLGLVKNLLLKKSGAASFNISSLQCEQFCVNSSW